MLKIHTVVYSDVGPSRELNEDNLFWQGHYRRRGEIPYTLQDIANSDEQVQIYAISDGIGGMAQGELASMIAVSDLEALTYTLDIAKIEDSADIIAQYLREKANYLWKRNKAKESLADHMGATISLLAIRNDRAYLANIGDSAVYQLSGNSLKQISRNDSHAAILRSLGYLTEEEEADHPFKHQLNNYLGKEYDQEHFAYFLVKDIPLAKGDIFLLCSDGISGVLTENEISEILKSDRSLKDKSNILVEKSLREGNQDNVSLILVEILSCKENHQLHIEYEGDAVALTEEDQDVYEHLEETKRMRFSEETSIYKVSRKPRSSENEEDKIQLYPVNNGENETNSEVKFSKPRKLECVDRKKGVLSTKQQSYYEKARKESLRRQEEKNREKMQIPRSGTYQEVSKTHYEKPTGEKPVRTQTPPQVEMTRTEKQRLYERRYMDVEDTPPSTKNQAPHSEVKIVKRNPLKSCFSWLFFFLLFVAIGFGFMWVFINFL